MDSGIPREDGDSKKGPLGGISESTRVQPSSVFQSRANSRRMFLANTAADAVPTSNASKVAPSSSAPAPPRAEARAPASTDLAPARNTIDELSTVAARSLSAATSPAADSATDAEARPVELPKFQRMGEGQPAARDHRDTAAPRPAKRTAASPRQPDGDRLKTERRESFRYPTPGVHLFISWPDSAGIHQQGPAHPERAGRNEPPVFGRMVRHKGLILNFSQTGLRLLISQLPPADRQLWVGIDESKNGTWSPVRLRSLDPADGGLYAVRLSFVDACPYDMFKHAVLRPMGEREAVAFRNGQNQG